MGERYYLRLPLTVVRNTSSCEDLRTADGIHWKTFKRACIALPLLEDNGEWIAMFRDAQEFMTGSAFRHLFALALQHTTITNLLAIWGEFRESFCNDLAHVLVTGRVIVPVGGEGMGAGLAHDYGVYHIQDFLKEYGRSLVEFGLPQQGLDWRQRENGVGDNARMGEELEYDIVQEQVLSDSMRQKLNEEQVTCFKAIVVLYHCLSSHFRAQGKIVLCVSSSGIAAHCYLRAGQHFQGSRFPFRITLMLCATSRETPPLVS